MDRERVQAEAVDPIELALARMELAKLDGANASSLRAQAQATFEDLGATHYASRCAQTGPA